MASAENANTTENVMKLEADAHKLMMELRETLKKYQGGSDHTCNTSGCKVCQARSRRKDRQAEAERRAGRTYGDDGLDPFRGFRE